MKDKLRDYIDMIFTDAPDCVRTRELKEEMYSNICDKYDDLIADGKSPAAAYNISVASIGDISEIIDSVKEEQSGFDCGDGYGESEGEQRYFTLAQQEEIGRYRKRSGIMTAVAVALYIVCWVPLVVISSVAEACGGNAEIWGAVGIAVMMVMIAVATVLMVMKSYLRPAFMKAEEAEDENKAPRVKKRKNPVLRAISSGIWTLTVVIFLVLGFFLGLWHPGWIVFIIATAIDNVVEAIFEITGKKYL